jgi:hypothetical protein
VIDKNGYYPGGGMLSPDKKIFYLAIPKNASTYLTNLLKANSWTHWNILENPAGIEKTIAVIRDPVDRWTSGFATYAALRLFGYGYGSDHFVSDFNDLSQRIIFDQVIFDDHTDLQVKYAKQILDYHSVFFRYNQNLVTQINSFLDHDLNTNVYVDANSSESNYDTKQISNFFTKQLIDNPDLKAKVIRAYKQDYEFINSIEFYNDPR